MSDSPDNSRGVAACEQCGTVFAVRVRSDGRIQPIGMPHNCTCGAEEFRLIE